MNILNQNRPFKPGQVIKCACGCGELGKISPQRSEMLLKGDYSPIFKHGHRWKKFPLSRPKEKASNWKGGRTLQSDGYIRLLKPGYQSSNVSGYVLEHRFVMEQHIGRKLSENEQVHHKNQDKTDNRLENLEIVLRKAHYGTVECPHCQRTFKLM